MTLKLLPIEQIPNDKAVVGFFDDPLTIPKIIMKYTGNDVLFCVSQFKNTSGKIIITRQSMISPKIKPTHFCSVEEYQNQLKGILQ